MENKYYIKIQASGTIGLSESLGAELGDEAVISFSGNKLSIANASQLKELGYEFEDAYKIGWNNSNCKVSKRLYAHNIYREITQYEPSALKHQDIKSFSKISSTNNYLEKGLKIFEFDLEEFRKQYKELYDFKQEQEKVKKMEIERKEIISNFINNTYQNKNKKK